METTTLRYDLMVQDVNDPHHREYGDYADAEAAIERAEGREGPLTEVRVWDREAEEIIYQGGG